MRVSWIKRRKDKIHKMENSTISEKIRKRIEKNEKVLFRFFSYIHNQGKWEQLKDVKNVSSFAETAECISRNGTVPKSK